MGALCYRGEISTSPNAAKRKALEFCLSGQVDLHRHLHDSPRFPVLARLPEAVSEAYYIFFQ